MKTWIERIKDQNDWNTPKVFLDKCSHCNECKFGVSIVACCAKELHVCTDCLVTFLKSFDGVPR